MSKQNPRIQIDDYEFVLEYSWTPDKNERKHIVYKSKLKYTQNEYKYFTSYKSMSEGLWRFCKIYEKDRYKDPVGNLLPLPNGRYYKCIEDYVTCTLIHFKLQQFFNTNYDKLQELKNPEDFSRYLVQDQKYTINELNYKRLYMEDTTILALTVILPKIVKTSFFYSTQTLTDIDKFIKINNFQDFNSNTIIKTYSLSLDHYEHIKVCLRYLLELQEKSFSELKNNSETVQNVLSLVNKNNKIIFKEKMDYLDYLYKTGRMTQKQLNDTIRIQTEIHSNNETNIITLENEPNYYKLKRTYEILSEYMETFFEVDERIQEHVASMNLELFDDSINKKESSIRNIEVLIPYNIYRTKITNKCERNVFDLYYFCYEYQNKKYKLICNIVPQNEKINEIGLFERYISIPPYVYKMF